MRLWAVTIDIRETREVQVVAASLDDARRAAQDVMPRAGRIAAVNELDTRAPLDSAVAALKHILHANFLPLFGQAASLLDWLTDDRPVSKGDLIINARWGLRVQDDDCGTPLALMVGSDDVFPTIANLVHGTPWQGTGLAAALRCLPGASSTNLTFAGRHARATRVPWDLILQAANGTLSP